MKNSRVYDAIRSVWSVARACGLAVTGREFTSDCRMSSDDTMRKAMVRCWLAGYRAALRDAKKGAKK